MLSSLCRHISTSVTIGRAPSAACLSSTAAASPSEQELVSVLKLNMLQDNPGAVKKVSYT
jgi:hypothetical protein